MATKVISQKDAHAQEIERLSAELGRLNSDTEIIRKKHSGDTEKLTAAQADRGRLVAKIQAGDADSTVLRAIDDQIATLEIRIGGYNDRLSEIRARTESLQLEISNCREAHAQAERDEQIAEVSKNGEALGLEIRTDFVALIQKIYEFDEIRIRLGRQLGDLPAARRLRELIFKPTGNMEALRTPELYWRELEDQGWSVRSNAPVHEVPGGNLHLSVVSMQPKPKL